VQIEAFFTSSSHSFNISCSDTSAVTEVQRVWHSSCETV